MKPECLWPCSEESATGPRAVSDGPGSHIHSYLVCSRSVLILSSYLSQGISSGLFKFLTKILGEYSRLLPRILKLCLFLDLPPPLPRHIRLRSSYSIERPVFKHFRCSLSLSLQLPVYPKLHTR